MTPEGKIVAFLVRRCKELGLYQRKLAYEGMRERTDTNRLFALREGPQW